MRYYTPLLLLVPLSVLAVETPVPERFLAPRDFNPHPITDVRRPASNYKKLNIPGPEEVYAQYLQHREPAYKGQQYLRYSQQPHHPPSDVHSQITQAAHAQFTEQQQRELSLDTTLHDSVELRDNSLDLTLQAQSSAHEEYTEKPYRRTYDENVPKQYAFSYAVLDHHSGDDFSHAQQHNGHSTEGQYRVKLPDGRVQVVRYTADDGGYRAKVSYEPAEASSPTYVPQPTKIIHTQPTPIVHTQSTPIVYTQPTPIVYTQPTPTANHYTAPLPTPSYDSTPYPYIQHVPTKASFTINPYQQFQQPRYRRYPTQEPRVQVAYNGADIQPAHQIYEDHQLYKRTNN